MCLFNSAVLHRPPLYTFLSLYYFTSLPPFKTAARNCLRTKKKTWIVITCNPVFFFWWNSSDKNKYIIKNTQKRENVLLYLVDLTDRLPWDMEPKELTTQRKEQYKPPPPQFIYILQSPWFGIEKAASVEPYFFVQIDTSVTFLYSGTLTARWPAYSSHVVWNRHSEYALGKTKVNLSCVWRCGVVTSHSHVWCFWSSASVNLGSHLLTGKVRADDSFSEKSSNGSATPRATCGKNFCI